MSAFGTLILHLADGREQRFALSKPTVHAGRAATSDVLLRDGKVSRQHARFECSDAGCTIVDLGSANGTFVNDRRITQAQLAHGDAIRMGDSILRYEVGVRTDEPDITLMDTPADVEKTLVEAHIATELNDTTQPRLVIVAPGWTWEVLLTAQALSLGRHADNDVDLEFPNVSRRHARVERRGDDLVLRDLGSANGTWVNGARVETHTLRDGDNIRIGPVILAFKRGFVANDLTVLDAELPQPGLAQRRPVVFVPGFMGTELWQGGARLWPNVRDILTSPERFAVRPDDGIEPRGLLGEVVIVPNLLKHEQYDRMGDFFVEGLGYTRGKDLLEVGYDWRQDNRISA
ncbi:MAG: FHA domain-containing protein, partial [Anaerolineae bacterium]|nr:FHA domain-containing protein [Anaerolineae bacterium]